MAKQVKTQSQKVAEQNAAAVQAQRAAAESTGELQKAVARGELSAAEALKKKMTTPAPKPKK